MSGYPEHWTNQS